jgi:hypothetical protein
MLVLRKSFKDALTRANHSAYRRISHQRWLILAVLFFPITVLAMDFFRFCLFSDVEGRVVLNGKPVVGAVVERTYRIGGTEDEISDKTTTDSAGYFGFGRIWKYSLLTFLPGEMNVRQRIWINHEGKKYEAWRLTKYRPLELDGELPPVGLGDDFDPRTYDASTKYPKRKIKLLCDLANEPSWKERYRGRDETLFGVCTVVNAL